MRWQTEKFLPKTRGKNRKKEIRCGMAKTKGKRGAEKIIVRKIKTLLRKKKISARKRLPYRCGMCRQNSAASTVRLPV